MKKINIILDIDNTLVKTIKKVKNPKSTIYQDGVYYEIYPCCLQFLRYVAKLMNNYLIFFSNGTKQRNDDLIKELLTRAFNKKSVKFEIYSRADHCFSPITKNLTIIVPKDQLNRTILIDDDPYIIENSQKKNMIVINNETRRNLYHITGLIKFSYELYENNYHPNFVEIINLIDGYIESKQIYEEGKLQLSRV